MPIAITGFYAALLALIAIGLGYRVGVARLASGISILHGDDMELAAKIRRHANFTESVPMALILMGIIELDGAPSGLLHGLGIALVASRIAHPMGLKHDQVRNPLRGIGAGGTTLVTLVAAATAIWHFVS